MPKSPGRTLNNALISQKALEQTFPNWTRKDLVVLCLSLIESFQSVHSVNALVGDVSPNNVLVSDDASAVLIDSDSFQIEGYLSHVYTSGYLHKDMIDRCQWPLILTH